MTAHWLKHIHRLDGAFSDHTLRSYRSDFGLFAAWCRKRRRPFLPASSETVAAYIETERPRLKPGTLKRRLAAIRKLHHLAGAGDPTRDAEVDLAMRRASRAQPSRPQQALGITAEKRDRLLAQCTDDLIGLRDRVLVSVGFDTLCRRGELVALSITDLTKREDGRYSVLVRRAKSDPEGRLEEKLTQLAKPKLLIVDELGYLPFEPDAAHLFFQLVSRRYERGAMLITSNRSVGEWGTVFADAVAATAILDRLLHHSHIITIRGESYRLREKRRSGILKTPLSTAGITPTHSQQGVSSA